MFEHAASEIRRDSRLFRAAAASNAAVRTLPSQEKLRVLFLAEGFTDIRFVVGLSETFELTMAVPSREYGESGLKERVAASGWRVEVVEIPGGRVSFQWRSLRYVWRNAPRFDAILAQEMLRGALNANLAGLWHGVPVVTYVAISPIEYFRCRYERREVGRLKAVAGELAIRTLLALNGRMSSRCVALGPYLRDVVGRVCPRAEQGLFYGIDVDIFRPADGTERTALRHRFHLPLDRFVIFFSSRVSHEKDPETLLSAVSLARSRGLDAIVLNLGGGYKQFVDLARRMGLSGTDRWIIARPAVHPMTEVFDYFRAADLVVQSSLAEGAGLSPLEALACGTPVVATAVGGMALTLRGHARLVPRRDASAMADEIMWVARHHDEARRQALCARDYVVREWNRERAFAELERIVRGACGANRRPGLLPI
jgi:glycosyltransferase involved in cell wall biosynthesis